MGEMASVVSMFDRSKPKEAANEPSAPPDIGFSISGASRTSVS